MNGCNIKAYFQYKVENNEICSIHCFNRLGSSARLMSLLHYFISLQIWAKQIHLNDYLNGIIFRCFRTFNFLSVIKHQICVYYRHHLISNRELTTDTRLTATWQQFDISHLIFSRQLNSDVHLAEFWYPFERWLFTSILQLYDVHFTVAVCHLFDSCILTTIVHTFDSLLTIFWQFHLFFPLSL